MQSERRAREIAEICNNNGIVFILGVEADKPEDVSDMDRALRPPEPVLADPKIGRNEPCPCGSGKKFKKCCAAASSAGT